LLQRLRQEKDDVSSLSNDDEYHHPLIASEVNMDNIGSVATSNITTCTPLSALLTIFKDRVDVDGSGIYFLCNLEERIEVAKAVKGIPFQSFRDLYMFCLAPVRVDDKEHVAAFANFAKQYVLEGKVYLNSEDAKLPNHIPKTSTQLLELENLHQIFELYLWLANQWGDDVFVDKVIALDCVKQSSFLISQGLKVVGQEKRKRGYHAELLGGRAGKSSEKKGREHKKKTRRGRKKTKRNWKNT
jgi:hypothetical protein